MAEKFEMRLNSKHRKRLLEDIEDKFRDMHDKDSRTADVEVALEKALEWMEIREEKKNQIQKKERQLRGTKETWDL